MKNYKRLTPFKRCVLQNFPFIEADFDALTNYGLLCKVVEYLNNVISSQNEVQANVETLNNAFIELKKYVDNFFENLDVQEEINNKLDAMTEDGTLERIIGDYISAKVYYYFPENWTGNSAVGDASIIKAFDKNILIDSSTSGNKGNLYNYLDRNNCQHLDYFMLSHYDPDHAGNLINLINDGYLDEESVVYLPASPSELGYSDVSATEGAIKTALTSANISYIEPDEGDTLELDETFKITFLNCNINQLRSASYVDYNKCSMICYVEHGGIKSIYTGDAFGEPMTRLIDEDLIEGKISLYKVEHHGLNVTGSTNYSLKFLEHTCPENAYFGINTKNFNENLSCGSATGSWLKQHGCNLYISYYTKEQVGFVSTPEGFSNISGNPTASVSNATITQTIYVDASSNEDYPDGSYDHPFKDLPQAFALAETENCSTEIHLSAGNYGVLHNTSGTNISRANNCMIKIVGDTENTSAVKIKNGINVKGGNITVDSVTLYADNGQAIYVVDSRLYCHNCNFVVSEDATPQDAIFSSNSQVTIKGCNFTGTNVGISSHDDQVYIANSTFDSIVTYPLKIQDGQLNMSNNTFVNLSTTPPKIIQKIGSVVLNMNYEQLYTGDINPGEARTVALSKDINLFNKIQLVGGTGGQNNVFTAEVYAQPGLSFGGNSYKFFTPDGVGTITFNSSNWKEAVVTTPTIIRFIETKIDELGRFA